MRNNIAAGAAHRTAKVAPKAERKYQQGLTLMQQARYDEAATAFEAAIERSPKDPLFWINLAQARRKLGRAEAAVEAARRAVALDPGSALARRMLGLCLNESGLHADAAAVLDARTGSDDERAAMLTERGLALQRAGQMHASVEPLLEAARLVPTSIKTHIALSDAFKGLDMPEAAWECQRTAVALDASNPYLLCSLIHLGLSACKWAGLREATSRLAELCAAGTGPAPVPFMHLSVPGASAQAHLRTAQAHCARTTGHLKLLPPVAPTQRRPGRIRVGYFSNDFHSHATAYLMARVLEHHDRSAFEVFAYSYGPDDGSPMRRRLETAIEHFVDVQHESARTTAERIRADGIDVLVDLKGYTLHARPEVLAYRPAPIQVNYLGYPGTMGAPFIDYIITDPVVTPPEVAGDFTEKFAYLPHSYQPNDDTRPVGPPPPRAECGLPDDAFVFCCFNNTYKITPQMFDIWCRLLAQVEGSVLWLLDANLQAKGNLRAEARARGIDPLRLIFAPKLPLAQHLARLANADLVLDTLPYNAHTTASDALWAGVPVVTCPGETFASRVAASLLRAAELPELVAASLEEYVSVALRLAQEPSGLAALKAKLRSRRSTCALFDSERYARNLEALYERMFERWRSGLPPDHLPSEQRGAIRAVICDDTAAEDSGAEALNVWSERSVSAATSSRAGTDDCELAKLRTALSLRPYDASLHTAYESAVKRRREPVPAAAIGLIITCEKYFKRALRLHAKLSALNVLPLRLVVGRGAKVPAHADLLEVDAPDDYESLPKKVRAAFVNAYERHGCAVFKIDDDLEINDDTRFVDDVRALIGGAVDYAGFEVGSPDHDRTWHWNKCRDAVLNRMPYGKRFRGTWANGPFYYLSASALRAFALATLRFPSEIDGELYEDKFVGDTLRAEGIRLAPLPAGAAGVAADNLPPAPLVGPAVPRPTPMTSPWAAQRLAHACPAERHDRPLKVAVVTPYYKEERRLIERCIDSVRAQTYGATHFVVADGFAQPWLDGAGVRHLRLDHAHADFGNTPRAIGGLLAVSEGFDAVCFLDADNWFEKDHVAACVDAALGTGSPDFVIARRRFVRLDGSRLPIDDAEEAHGHIDTNCYFLLRSAFHTIARWATMPRPLACIGDRVFAATMRAEGLRAVRVGQVTVNYLCTWASLFRLVGEDPPPYAKENVDPSNALRWLHSLEAADRRIADRLIGARLHLAPRLEDTIGTAAHSIAWDQ
jgi:predicted O-linked N-acetylglucosamine transferase (SPINDLY family)